MKSKFTFFHTNTDTWLSLKGEVNKAYQNVAKIANGATDEARNQATDTWPNMSDPVKGYTNAFHANTNTKQFSTMPTDAVAILKDGKVNKIVAVFAAGRGSESFSRKEVAAAYKEAFKLSQQALKAVAEMPESRPSFAAVPVA